MSIIKVVLTGGPCAGKSTALNLLYEHLKNKYNVIIISETATELINSGIKPFGDGKIDFLEFQHLILNYQLMKEKLLCTTNFDNEKDTIVVCDRGLMDNKAYLNNKNFNLLLNKNNMQEISLLDRYDSVIHLVTAADGAEQFYTLANNNARTETIEEAKIRDEQTKKAWLGHDDLYIVTNDFDFNNKIEKIISIIDNILQDKVLKIQHKYLLEQKYIDKALELIPYNKILIEQQYVLKYDTLYRIRKRTLNNNSSYNISIEELLGSSNKNISAKRQIDCASYFDFINKNSDKIRILKKIRYFFIYENQYFKIDELENGLCMLEISGVNNIKLPKFLPIIDEVTDNDKYYNYQLSKKI